MAGNGWTLLHMARNGWKFLEIAGNGLKLLEIALQANTADLYMTGIVLNMIGCDDDDDGSNGMVL